MNVFTPVARSIAALAMPWRRQSHVETVAMFPILDQPEFVHDLTAVDPAHHHQPITFWTPKPIHEPKQVHSIDEHARRLFEWIVDGTDAPFELLSDDVQAMYLDMLTELWWAPAAAAKTTSAFTDREQFDESFRVSWPRVAGRLGKLAGRPIQGGDGEVNHKPYIWIVTENGRDRKRTFWFDASRFSAETNVVAVAPPKKARRRKAA